MSTHRILAWIDESKAAERKPAAFRRGWDAMRAIFRRRIARGELQSALNIALSVGEMATGIRADYFFVDTVDKEERAEGDGMLSFLTALHVNADKIEETASGEGTAAG